MRAPLLCLALAAPALGVAARAEVAAAAATEPRRGGPAAPPQEMAPTATGALTLSECFRIAAAHNERIGRAREDQNEAVSLKSAARAAVLPSLSVENVYFQQNQVEIAPSGDVGSAFAFAHRRNDLYLRLSQPIFSGLRDRNFLASTDRLIEASRRGVQEARRLLYADVAAAFYGVLQRQGEVETLEDSVAVERERLREVRARQEVGLARRTEYLLVEAQLAEDEADLTQARNALLVTRELLGFLMGRPVDGPLRDDVEPPAELGEVPPGAEEARRGRSDLQQLEQVVEAARYRLAVARGEYFPTVDLEARAYLDRRNVSVFAEETDWTAEVTVSVPLFDGGRARASVFNARADLARATLDRDERARRISLEVETAWRTLQSDLARLRTLETSVAAADESSRLVQEEYRGGLATNLEVITAHNLLLSSRLERERQRHQVKLDWVTLELARGRLADDSGGDPGAPAAPEEPETRAAEGPIVPPAAPAADARPGAIR